MKNKSLLAVCIIAAVIVIDGIAVGQNDCNKKLEKITVINWDGLLPVFNFNIHDETDGEKISDKAKRLDECIELQRALEGYTGEQSWPLWMMTIAERSHKPFPDIMSKYNLYLLFDFKVMGTEYSLIAAPVKQNISLDMPYYWTYYRGADRYRLDILMVVPRNMVIRTGEFDKIVFDWKSLLQKFMDSDYGYHGVEILGDYFNNLEDFVNAASNNFETLKGKFIEINSDKDSVFECTKEMSFPSPTAHIIVNKSGTILKVEYPVKDEIILSIYNDTLSSINKANQIYGDLKYKLSKAKISYDELLQFPYSPNRMFEFEACDMIPIIAEGPDRFISMYLSLESNKQYDKKISDASYRICFTLKGVVDTSLLTTCIDKKQRWFVEKYGISHLKNNFARIVDSLTPGFKTIFDYNEKYGGRDTDYYDDLTIHEKSECRIFIGGTNETVLGSINRHPMSKPILKHGMYFIDYFDTLKAGRYKMQVRYTSETSDKLHLAIRVKARPIVQPPQPKIFSTSFDFKDIRKLIYSCTYDIQNLHTDIIGEVRRIDSNGSKWYASKYTPGGFHDGLIYSYSDNWNDIDKQYYIASYYTKTDLSSARKTYSKMVSDLLKHGCVPIDKKFLTAKEDDAIELTELTGKSQELFYRMKLSLLLYKDTTVENESAYVVRMKAGKWAPHGPMSEIPQHPMEKLWKEWEARVTETSKTFGYKAEVEAATEIVDKEFNRSISAAVGDSVCWQIICSESFDAFFESNPSAFSRPLGKPKKKGNVWYAEGKCRAEESFEKMRIVFSDDELHSIACYVGRKQNLVVSKSIAQYSGSGDVWNSACAAARDKMSSDGFTVILDRPSAFGDHKNEFPLNEVVTLRWYILANGPDMNLLVTTPKGVDHLPLQQDGDKPIYYSSGEETAYPGNYSFNLTGSSRSFAIIGRKKSDVEVQTDQDKARQRLKDEGYTIIFESTERTGYHEPVTAILHTLGEIAWVAFTKSECSPLTVFVDGAAVGTESTIGSIEVNSGSTILTLKDEGTREGSKESTIKAMPSGNCDSPTTLIIGGKQ